MLISLVSVKRVYKILYSGVKDSIQMSGEISIIYLRL